MNLGWQVSERSQTPKAELGQRRDYLALNGDCPRRARPRRGADGRKSRSRKDLRWSG